MFDQHKSQNRSAAAVVLAVVFLFCSGIDQSRAAEAPVSLNQINGSIDFGEDDPTGAELKTVNGGVRILPGNEAGAISTVNGPIRLAGNAVARAARSVNGAITIGENATVRGTVQAVNGGITLEYSSAVTGDVFTINGLIRVDGAVVGGSVSTVNGNILIREGSTIQGDITFKEAAAESSWITRLFGFGNGSQRSRLDIGAGVTVEGDIHLHREVDLHIGNNARIGDIIRYY